MKNWVWSVFVFVITFGIIFFVELSFFSTFLILIPALIIAFIYGSFVYSFRDSLKPEEIPATGYGGRVTETENKLRELPLGFKKIDRFYLKAVPDSITYAFLNENEPVIGCLYHFGKKMGADFVTLYNDGYSLTTNNSFDGGMAPRYKKAFIQLFPEYDYEKLYGKHMESHIFLIEKGLRPVYIQGSEFRFYFMKEFKAQGEFIRKIPFWPVILLFRTISQYGKKYNLSIKKQYEKGMIKIFD